MLPALGTLAEATLRLWRLNGDRWLLVAGPPDAAAPPTDTAHPVASRLAIAGVPGLYLDVRPDHPGGTADDLGRGILPLIDALVEAHRAVASVTNELAARYEEIDLLYTLGQMLGQAPAIEQVATLILREVSAVLGARRAGMRLYDEERQVLRSVALTGPPSDAIPAEVPVAEPDVVVTRAFRSQRIETGVQPEWVDGEVLAVPMIYSGPGVPARVVGTLALAERAGGGSFTREETKLVAAVAAQIAAALENARLAARERERERVARELELAHDLQVKLMPAPDLLRGEADVAVRSEATEALGGDFYTLLRLGPGRIGVMLGDVSSHGFSAALIAAQVMTAAGVHARSSTPPDEALGLLRQSLSADLEKTEMHLTLVYVILDRAAGELVYSNAGHHHAFRVPAHGPAERLSATAPPLGLAAQGGFGRRTLPWEFGRDLLVLFTDGLADQRNPSGERFGEERLLALVERNREATPGRLLERVAAAIAEFGGEATDDCTLLLLRM